MDLDIIQSTKEGEITQFLCDARDYFKASLATSEYENTSNMFYLTASETTEQLLNRCECLLNRLKIQNPVSAINIQDNIKDESKTVQWHGNKNGIDNEDVSYLDMSASHMENDKTRDSDISFRCSTFVAKQNKSFLHRLHNTMATTSDNESDMGEEKREYHENDISELEDAQIYDICQVTTQGSDGEEDEVGVEETQKAIKEDTNFSLPNVDCPYIDLPAGHLSIKKSIKYGQLLKVEKKLFFDQSKKCFCGILTDWLLCYADGPTSNKPTISLYLKIPGIEIEHFGEGKRRNICFQITTSDPNKRFVFQAVNEIDAKEWIHAIESAIRSDTMNVDIKNSLVRKLPTPPVMKKITFLKPIQGETEMLPNATVTSNDGIYEEPSPIHQFIPNTASEKRPELPDKQKSSLEFTYKFQYDVPKSPPQPFKDTAGNDVLLINPYENNKTTSPEKNHTVILSESLCLGSAAVSGQKLSIKMEENLDFQAKVKDVHYKLTSQLSSGPNTKKSVKKSLAVIPEKGQELLPSPLPETIDFKKLKKPSNSSNSPQKISNAKNWFLNRLSKTTSSTRNSPTSQPNSPPKNKQSENENLLNSSSDVCDSYDSPASPVMKASSFSSGTSKVNMIINQLEASGHLPSMFNIDNIASFSPFCDNDFNNYEPIMTVSTPPTNIIKKV